MKEHFMHPLVVMLLTGGAVFLAFGQASTPTSGRDQLAEQEVRRLNAKEVDAFVHNDPKTMAQLWSDDFVVTNPLNFSGWSNPASWRSRPTNVKSSISGSMPIQ